MCVWEEMKKEGFVYIFLHLVDETSVTDADHFRFQLLFIFFFRNKRTYCG